MEEIVAAGGYASVIPLGSGFNNPIGIALNGSGNIFVVELLNNAVKELLAAGGYTNTIPLGSGLSFARGAVVDRSGNLFIADSGNNGMKAIMTQSVNFGSAAIATSIPLQIQLTLRWIPPAPSARLPC